MEVAPGLRVTHAGRVAEEPEKHPGMSRAAAMAVVSTFAGWVSGAGDVCPVLELGFSYFQSIHYQNARGLLRTAAANELTPQC